MDQLKIARHNTEIGKYDVASSAYKAALMSFNNMIKTENDNDRRSRLVNDRGLIEKELQLLGTLTNELSRIKVSGTPETPTDPMVWPAPPPLPKRTSTLSRVRKPVASSDKRTPAPTPARRVGPVKSAATATGPKSIRRTTSHPRLANTNGTNENSTIDMDNTTSEKEDKVFDSSSYDRELVETIERSVIQRDLNVHWQDIAGNETTKKLLSEAALLPLIFPDFFKGIRRPWRGVCLFGPPGTGKTMLAKAVATECNTTFFSLSASSFASKWRGDSEKLVRLLFEMARFHAPSTIFIDEIDSVCSRRGSDSEHEASRRMKSELLVQIDGLGTESDKPVLLLAATNCPWDLDDAFRRRLEKRIYIGLPDFETRLSLLKQSLVAVKVDDDVQLDVLSTKMDGYSGADITNVCRDAALQPMRECIQNLDDYRSVAEQLSTSVLEDKPIRMAHFEMAMQRVSPSCTTSDVKKYLEWQKIYGAT